MFIKENRFTVTPEQLIQQLESASCALESLCEELHCTPQDLAHTLDSPEISQLLKLKATLAALQIQVVACKFAPHAIAKIVELTDSEKPEVARRCAMTLVNIVGTPTTTASQTPIPTPISDPIPQYKAEDINEDEADRAMILAGEILNIKRGNFIDLTRIPDHLYSVFLDTLANFFDSHNLSHGRHRGADIKPNPNDSEDSSPNDPAPPNDPLSSPSD